MHRFSNWIHGTGNDDQLFRINRIDSTLIYPLTGSVAHSLSSFNFYSGFGADGHVHLADRKVLSAGVNNYASASLTGIPADINGGYPSIPHKIRDRGGVGIG